MLVDLTGRVALVTGGRRGIGRAIAAAMVGSGARVAINARAADGLDAVAAELAPEVLAVPGDVSVGDTARAIVESVVRRFGKVDVLVNNAAAVYGTRFEDITEDEWRRSLDVNLTGAFLMTRAVLPSMKAGGWGRVVNISSIAGRSVAKLGGAHYTASKAGLQGLTRAAAAELGPLGITVNAVCPGPTDTELIHETATDERLEGFRLAAPTRRLGRPEDVADLVCFLASDRSGQITGASFDVNGGLLMI